MAKYEVRDVVCDYGVFENGELKLILNSRAIALRIVELLIEDEIRHRELNSDLLDAYKRKMMDALDDGDEEIGHIECDGVLCDLLNELGFGEIVEIYERQEKWYA